MKPNLDELSLQRGRLIERIAAQRAGLRQEIAPIANIFAQTDRVVERGRSVVDWIKRYPIVTGACAAALLATNFRRSWRIGLRALTAWKTWKLLNRRWKAANLSKSPR